MERIYLTYSEKFVLRIIFQYPLNEATKKLRYDKYNVTLFNLREKGFIEYNTDNDDLVKRIVVLPYAYNYIYSNPKLKNPINWAKIAAFGAIITAIASVIGLFIGCTLLKLN